MDREKDFDIITKNNMEKVYITGLDGRDGDIGPTGPCGLVGPRGPQGKMGQPGKIGPTGAPGLNGMNGTNGTNGKNGKNGTNGTDGTNGINGKDGKNVTFKNEWNKTKQFIENDIVYDPHDYDNLYICLDETVDVDIPPSKSKNWKLFLGRNFIFRGMWNKTEVYKKNHAVVDSLNKSLYLSKRDNPHKNIPPSANKNSWHLVFSSDWLDVKNEIKKFKEAQKDLEGLINQTNQKTLIKNKGQWKNTDRYFTNDIVNYQNDVYICKQANRNENNPSINNINWELIFKVPTSTHNSLFFASLKTSSANTFLEFRIKKKLEFIPLNHILNNESRCYDNKRSNVTIKENGSYRFTYNIVYHGSLYNLTSGLTIMDNSSESSDQNKKMVSYSLNNSQNRMNNDTLPDQYYEKINNLEENIKYMNHSFIIPIYGGEFTLSLALKFNPRNVNKKIYIHPQKTWMTIEKIN
jgi:hypothetical protein